MKIERPTSKAWLTVGLVVLATLLAACGSSSASSSSSAGSGGTPSHNSGPSGSVIKIGLVCTCSGPLAAGYTQIPSIYQAWVSTVNASGGINGHKVQVISKNDAGSPGTSLSDVQALVTNDHVLAIVDATNDDQVWASFVQQHQVPVIGMNQSTQPMYTNPDFYPEGQTEDALFPSIVGAAKAAGASNLGLLYCAEAVQCQEGIAPLKQVGKAIGVPVVYAGSVSATAPNYTAQCIAAQQAHVKALFIADIPSVISKVGLDCSQQGYHPPVVIDGESMYPYLASATGIKENTTFAIPDTAFFSKIPAIATMDAALNKYAPGVASNSNTSWGEYAAETWYSGELFAAAAAAGHLGAGGSTPTSAQLVKGLTSLKGATLGGLTPPLTFPAGQAHPIHCWFLAHLTSGKYTTSQTPVCEGN